MPECCQTCDGSVVPPNKVVSTIQQGGGCQVREVAICKTVHRDVSIGSIEVSYESDLCCSDTSGWAETGSIRLEPENCAVRTCSPGSPAHWDNRIIYPGSCNCCAYNGSLVADGETVSLQNGMQGKCCDGRISATLSSTIAVTSGTETSLSQTTEGTAEPTTTTGTTATIATTTSTASTPTKTTTTTTTTTTTNKTTTTTTTTTT